MSHPSATPSYALLVPVKPVAVAKSRLAPLGDGVRRELVTAFVHDTVAAGLAARLVERVLVVTDDHRLASSVARTGVAVLPDGVSGSLNGTLVQAAHEAARRWPSSRPAVLCADLPSLRPEDLDTALSAAMDHPSAFVADQAGTGTTMLAARCVDELRPWFGSDSRAAHRTDGAVELEELSVPSLRLDVDTPHDLFRAVSLGVGPNTLSVLRAAGLGGAAGPGSADRATTLR